MSELPSVPIVRRLDAELRGPGRRAMLSAKDFRELCEAAELNPEQGLLACLPWARRWARAQVSGFEVGAAARGGSGRVYLSANLEFAGLPLAETVHAEQAALAWARAAGEHRLTELATSAAPCGLCRQFMLELAEPPRLLVPGCEPATLAELLPASFGPDQLGRRARLLDPPAQQLLADGELDALASAARGAAEHSSSPYADAPAGVALASADGETCVGAVLESVAFNPTLGAMQAALVVRQLASQRERPGLADIVDAVLVEVDDARVSQHEAAQRVLASVAPGVELRRVALRRARR